MPLDPLALRRVIVCLHRRTGRRGSVVFEGSAEALRLSKSLRDQAEYQFVRLELTNAELGELYAQHLRVTPDGKLEAVAREAWPERVMLEAEMRGALAEKIGLALAAGMPAALAVETLQALAASELAAPDEAVTRG